MCYADSGSQNVIRFICPIGLAWMRGTGISKTDNLRNRKTYEDEPYLVGNANIIWSAIQYQSSSVTKRSELERARLKLEHRDGKLSENGWK